MTKDKAEQVIREIEAVLQKHNVSITYDGEIHGWMLFDGQTQNEFRDVTFQDRGNTAGQGYFLGVDWSIMTLDPPNTTG